MSTLSGASLTAEASWSVNCRNHGPVFSDGVCTFRLWAPRRRSVRLVLIDDNGETDLPMHRGEEGWWTLEVGGVTHGRRYAFRFRAGARWWPDPASAWQPEGVHGPSAVVDHSVFPWPGSESGWAAPPLSAWVLYELHVGLFGSTFEGCIPKLDRLRDLGVTAVEIMPVSQFPGSRNWGYDGVYPYAAQNSYGGPDGLKALVAACHERGMAAVLDVVYNHFGPEGCYVERFGPYFSEKHRTPWGRGVNYDDRLNRGVREYIIGNALHWLEHFRFDGLRLDAVPCVVDDSDPHILTEVSNHVAELSRRQGRPLVLIAETDDNEAARVTPAGKGGQGMHALWNDDFHHAVHAMLTGERGHYFANFGTSGPVADTLRQGFHLDGRPCRWRGRTVGSDPSGMRSDQFINFLQNHDMTGNRCHGERLAALIPREQAALAAALLCLAPGIPMLFMGEEYMEPSPFLYFVDHGDDSLRRAVLRGRRGDCLTPQGLGLPSGASMPDPSVPKTYAASGLKPHLAEKKPHSAMLGWYRDLLTLRRTHPALSEPDVIRPAGQAASTPRSFSRTAVWEGKGRIAMLRVSPDGCDALLALFNCAETEAPFASLLPDRLRNPSPSGPIPDPQSEGFRDESFDDAEDSSRPGFRLPEGFDPRKFPPVAQWNQLLDSRAIAWDGSESENLGPSEFQPHQPLPSGVALILGARCSSLQEAS